MLHNRDLSFAVCKSIISHHPMASFARMFNVTNNTIRHPLAATEILSLFPVPVNMFYDNSYIYIIRE